MLIVSTYIEFEKYFFDYASEVEILSAWNNLSDTATIKFPRLLKADDRLVKLDEQIKYGEKLSISLGYDGNLNKVFEGNVTSISPTAPVVIKCDDKMFELKRTSIKPKGWKNASIEEVLQYIGITKYDLLGKITLGEFLFDSTTKNAAQALAKLKETTKLPIFFRNGILNVGKPYDPDVTKVRKEVLRFGYNVLSHDLEFKRKEDVLLKVKAVSHLPNGKKIELELGDFDGESRTLDYYNLKEAELKARATAQIEQLKYDGWRGSITIYGEPYLQHGDIVILEDWESEKTGQYYIDEVKTTLGSNGIRQVLKLGARA